MTRSRFERITVVVDGQRTTRRVEVICESDVLLRAHILDANWDRGGEFAPTGEEIEKVWLLDKSVITKRVPMRENRTFGTWEPEE